MRETTFTMPRPLSGKRKAISLTVKKEIIERKEKGEGNTAIGRSLGLNEACVRSVWRKKEDIKKAIKAYGTSNLDCRLRELDQECILCLTPFFSRKNR